VGKPPSHQLNFALNRVFVDGNDVVRHIRLSNPRIISKNPVAEGIPVVDLHALVSTIEIFNCKPFSGKPMILQDVIIILEAPRRRVVKASSSR